MILGFTGGGGASGSGLTYKGTWDALTNNPFLASGVGTDGDYYIVSVAGTTNLDGITSWGIGDWAIFNGGTWQKINNSTGSGTVTSVGASGGTGISISGTNPITASGVFTITNTAPDQVVSITDGTGISTTGTYPNFTITNTAPSSGGTVTSVELTSGTGISLSGTNPITSSGTINITNSAPDQVVSLTDGTAITTSGTYPNFTITNDAPDQTVVLNNGTGISVSGTYPNFTITNTQPSSGGTVTSVGLTMPSAFSVANSPVTGSATLNVTATGTSSQVILGDGTLGTLPVTTGYVPYTGASANVDLGTFNLTADHIALNVNPSGAGFVVGATEWNNTDGTSETLLKGGNVILKNGVDLVARVVNNTSVNLLRANYQVVKVSGAQGQRLAVDFAQANNDNNSADTLGIVAENINNNLEGFILTVGQLLNINTTGSLQGETWADGDVLYLSPTIAGAITNIKPTALVGHIVVLGYVEYAHVNNGKIYVKIMNGWELDELHNVYINNPLNNNILTYVTPANLWENRTLGQIIGGVTSQYVRGDGSVATFPTITGGGSSVTYYLNGGTSQGTIGGSPYYQMNKTATIGTGVDFSLTNTTGYIAQFITNVSDPSLLNIPGGAWNILFYFSSSLINSAGSFYVELYKYDGATFTLIADSSASPEFITNGTAIDLYTTSIAVPNTTLAITDRLAIRVFVNTNGNKTITLHTQDNHLCEVVTTFSTGINTLNSLSTQVQYFGTSTTGTDFTISSATDTHTFNLPIASASNNGKLSSSDWTTFNNKVSTTRTISTSLPLSGGGDLSANRTLSIAQSNTTTDGYLSGTDWTTFNSKIGGSGTSGFVTRFTGTSTIGDGVIQDNGTNLGIGVAPNTPFKLRVSTSTASQYAIYGEGLGQGFSGVAGISNGVGALQNVGVYGSSINSTSLNVGVQGEVDNASSVNIGGQFSATSGSANYSLQLQDGSEASGRFLKSVTSDGKANWVNVTIQDTNLAVTTTGTSGVSTLVGNTINIPEYVGDSIFTQTYRGISINNNTTTVVSDGGVVMSSSASTTAQTVASTNFATKQIRLRYSATVVSGGRYTGTRGTALLWFLHAGFRYVCDFNISDTSFSAGCQQFYGLAGVTTDLNYGGVSGTLVSTLTNIIGVGSETGDANLQVFHNDSGGTATKIDLGVNFPANRTAGAISTTVYSINLYNPVSSTSVLYKVTNNETGAIAQGTISTDLPATTTGLNFFASRCMSVTSVTSSGQFDLSKLGVYSSL